MKFQRKKINLDIERKIIIGMIVSDDFLKEIQFIYNQELFQTSFSKIISKWCIEYFEKYQKAPKSIIQELFNGFKSQKNVDENQIEIISDFLESLSFEYEEENFNNIKYQLDQAEYYFQRRSVEILKDNLSACLLKNDVQSAETLIGSYKQYKRPTSDFVDILEDDSVIEEICKDDDEILLELPGALGKIVGKLKRTDFLAVLAPPKRGKTWELLEIAIRSLLANLKVLFISLEMSRKEVSTRIYQHFTSCLDEVENQVITIPFFNKDNEIEYKNKKFKGKNSTYLKRKRKQLKQIVRGGKFKIKVFPTKTLTILQLHNELSNLENYHDFVPDVIVVDYADIMRSTEHTQYRHQLDDIWANLRSIAQDKNCLVVTGSQSGKIGLSHDISEKDIAEDMRKLAHVTTLLCLNQSKEDYNNGIMRIVTPTQRGKKIRHDEVVVLQCLDIGKPYLDSRFKKEVLL